MLSFNVQILGLPKKHNKRKKAELSLQFMFEIGF